MKREKEMRTEKWEGELVFFWLFYMAPNFVLFLSFCATIQR